MEPPPAIEKCLREAAGWVLLATLVYAPWALGGLPPWAIAPIERLLALAIGFWVAGCIIGRRWPRVSSLAWASAGLILLDGWGMAMNAHDVYIAASRSLTPVASLWPDAPGAPPARAR